MSISANDFFCSFNSKNEFIDKNNDALHASLEAIIQESKDSFLKSLFPQRSNKKVQKLIFESVGAKFKVNLKYYRKKISPGSPSVTPRFS